MIRVGMAAVLVVGLLGPGCSEEQEPQPQFNTTMSYEGHNLGPLETPQRGGDRSLIGPAATADEVRAEVEEAVSAPPTPAATAPAEAPDVIPPQPEGANLSDFREAAESAVAFVARSIATDEGVAGEPLGATGEMDLSTARGTAEAYATMLRQGAYRQLGEVLAEEIRAPVAQVVEAIEPLLTARRALLEALDTRFPQHGLLITLPQTLTFGLTERWEVSDVTEVGPDQALVRVTSADGQIATAWPVQRVGDTWQLVLPAQVPFLEDPQFRQAVADAADRLARIAQGLREGTIANVDEAAVALDEAADAITAQTSEFSPL